MFIKRIRGYELEKEKSNTSEDFFNRSEVEFVEDGKVRTIHLLYVRYFDEKIAEHAPFGQESNSAGDGSKTAYKDMAALAWLLQHPEARHRKRIYINSEREYAELFNHLDASKFLDLVRRIEVDGGCEISSFESIRQPI